MASTQAETEAVPSKNGPEIKDQADGHTGQSSPITTNGVDSQLGEGATTNGPGHLNAPNNGAHEVNDVKQQGNYFKPLPPSSYQPSDSMAPGYENAQSAYGYLPHGYDGQQQQNSYPYQQQQFSGSNNSIRSTGSYMNSMPRAGAPPPPQSPQSYPSHQGYMPPSRYPTPTLNQLLQPGSGAPVQRYPYGDYPPPPNSHPAAGWPMQQPQQQRSYAPSPGFKSPPNSVQQQGGPGGYPGYGASPAVPPGNNVQQAQQRYAVSPSGVPPMHQQHPEAVKNSGNGGVEPSTEVNSSAVANNAAVQQNSNSPSPSSATPASAAGTATPVTATAAAAASAVTSTSSVAATPPTSSSIAAAPLSSPAVIPPAPSPANRSMSPALGPPSNISPSPVVGSSENNSTGSTRISHSPMAAQGAYQQPMPPPPHVGMSSFKIGGPPYQQHQQSMSSQPQQPQYLPNPMYMQQQHARPPVMGSGGPNPYGTGPYGPPQQQTSQQHHTPQQSTPPHHHHQQPHQQGGMPPSSVNNPMPPASPGSNRSLPPHMGPPTPYPGYPSGAPNMNQYVHQQPSQQQQQPQQQQSNWGPSNPPGSPMQSMHGAAKGTPVPPVQAPGGNGPRTSAPSQTAPHYTKQHLQHHLQQQQQQKMYGMVPSPGPALPPAQGQQQQPPPASQQQQLLGPYPPVGNNMTSHPPSAASPVTSVVTTGPDGAAVLDEASQQSTLSNTSAASGDDASSAPSTPRSRKENTGPMSIAPSAQHHMPFPQHQQHPMMSHPPTPQSTVPSPGAASLSSQHDDYNDGHSPGPVGNWAGISTRPTPSSPKTSHMSDSLARMYDFDDHPDRRKFLDQLLRFMEEKGSPITACPTISKNPLDLFRLYLLVRDRGGFLEVTKAKSWKDIAQTLGIGASSSAAYTLRKHYTKSLFLWECKFDRGGVDPQPILNQVEASTKKKPPKALSVPSPAGSSNSQDSFQSTGVPPAHPPMDGYPNYPGYPPPHAGENIAANNPFDDQQHYGGRGGHPYPAPQASQQQQPAPSSQQQQQQPPPPPPPPSMYNTLPGRPGYPNHPGQGYHHPYPNDYPNPNNQQFPPYPNPPNRTMYPAPYPEPYNPQAPPSGPHQQGPPPPGPPGPTPTDPYGRYMPPNHGGGSNAPSGSYPQRPTAPPSTATVHPPSASTTPAPAPSPSPASVASSVPASLPVTPSSLAQSMQQPQQPQGNSSAGPSPAPSPAPSTGGPIYPEQNDQFQSYPGGSVPGSISSSAGQPYPNMVRPGTPGSVPPGMPSRQSTPTPVVPTPSSSVGTSNTSGSAPPPVAAGQQQQQLAPYPNYGPPGQTQNQQSRPYDSYSGYRSPYGPPGPIGDPSVSGNPSINNLATGWRGSAPYGNQYPPQGGSPGPVQTAGVPWVPPTGTPQPRNPAWDQNQRYPGPMPAAPATTYNGTSHQAPTPTMPPQHQQQPQWAGPPSVSNSRPPYPMGPRPPFRSSDGKPHSMPPMPGKGPMNIGSGLPGSAPYPPSGMHGGPMGMPVYAAKREASYFPTDCVEGVVPVMNKRRRVGRVDVSPVDPWRLYLALKSGLLGESTWAIDILNILLYDDVGVQYFSLAYMPGLVEVLLEHLRQCLSQIFTILNDMEMGFGHIEDLKRKMKLRVIRDSSSEARHANSSKLDKETMKTAEDSEDEEEAWWNWPKRKAEPDRFEAADLGSVKESDMIGDRVRFLEGPDWSMSSRRSEKIGTVPREKELFILDNKKDWDVHDGTGSSMEQTCGGDASQHIVTHFTAELNIVPFVRLLKQRKKRSQQVVDGTNPSGETELELVDQSSVVFQIERQLIEPRAKTKNCKAKLGRSLADVLQRIKREDQPPSPSVNHETSNDKDSTVEQVTHEKAVEVQPTDKTSSWQIKKEHCSIPVKRELTLSPPLTFGETDSSSAESKAGTLIIRDPHGTLKRKKMDDYEDECFTRDESSLCLVDDSQEALSRRALALSNIFRSLSFVPSNEGELAKNSTLLVIVGKLLLLHHDHPVRSAHQKNYDREEDIDFSLVDTLTTSSNTSAGSIRPNETDWWWDTLLILRENVLVLMANIAGQLDLSMYSEEVVRPLIDGLLHWAVCPSAQSQDPFGSFGPCSTSLLSPQRLSLEALCKLLVMDVNMDLILATPPFSRLEKLVHFLTRSLCRTEDQVLREFSINLLYYFSAADSGMARLIALHNNSLALLVSFVEQAEANALAVASQHGIQALRENPESMGTSLDMLRRAASTLFHIARHPDSRPLLAKLEQRLLALVMSQIMDQSVAALLSKSLYLCNSIDE